jgi:UDP:flavonoid glycosyltransferase YjiC (YdhE family)
MVADADADAAEADVIPVIVPALWAGPVSADQQSHPVRGSALSFGRWHCGSVPRRVKGKGSRRRKPVRILVVAVGSTGDVAPYLGLGQQITRRGFDVTVATHRSFQPMVEDAALGYAFVPVEPREWASDEFGERLRRGPRSAAAALAEMFGPSASAIADAVDSACDGADHVLLSAMAWTGVHSADARGLPSAGVHLQPLEPTAAFAPPVAGVRSLGPILNRALGRRGQTMMVAPYMEAANAIRAKHGLPAITARQHLGSLRDRDWPVWHGFSDAVVPRPRDWHPGLKAVGYWWPPAPRG